MAVDGAARTGAQVADGFRHEVALYRGLADLARVVLPFIREGVARREPVMVAMVPERLELLEHALGADATRVDFVDMAELGANPACIIPEWRRFLEDTSDLGPVRGVAEPVWQGRRPVELVETELHEALLNVAFDGGPPWRLLCPYDLTALPGPVVDDAVRHHPHVYPPAAEGHDTTPGAGSSSARRTFQELLPPAPGHATRLAFHDGGLAALRRRVRDLADGAGLARSGRDNLVLAVHELAANSILHAGGGGVLTSWRQPDALVVEVRDRGHIEDALVGRGPLDLEAENGRGIWIANQLCDLVQVRSGPDGTQVRLWTWVEQGQWSATTNVDAEAR
ncbi:MAG TPA: sensor histidine kinase [Nocardioides sp.]|nr:sensor histidine kinase [Nocardioides sp.]